MAVDMAVAPWPRLVALSPPGTTDAQRQEAADRYAIKADVFAAAADLWEDAANGIDLTPPTAPATPAVSSVSQDGISVSYAVGVIDYDHSQRIAQHAQYIQKAQYYRSRSKPTSLRKDGRVVDAFEPPEDEDESVIEVI